MATIPNEEKVFMVSNGTNTTYSGSASLKAMQEWYTMQDVTDTVRPYQVFTALLTQSGGDDPISANSTTGDLTIGVSYQIIDNGGSGWDFTNIGAPNNNIGTYFIATGTTPNSWGIDGQLDYNAGAPTATVLENTIGDIWFSYTDVGNYAVNSTGLFTSNKTVSINNLTRCINSGDGFYNLYIYQSSINTIRITTLDDSIENVDDQLSQKMIEIRVYN
jgi:hypothetical protein